MAARHQRFVSVGTRLSLGTTLLVTVLAALIYTGLTRSQWRATVAGKSKSAQMVGTLFGEIAATPLVFDDQKGIDEAIRSLMANQDVRGVRVARIDHGVIDEGAPLAEARREGFQGPLRWPWAGATSVSEQGPTLVLSQGISDSDGANIAQAVVAFSLEQELQDDAALSRRILITAAAGAFSLIVLLLLMARAFIVRPMRRLVKTAQSLEAGRRVSSGIDSADEVGALATALDTMARTVWEREAAIAQRNSDLKLVLDSVSQGFLLVNASGEMGPQRSAVLSTWFGEPPASNRFAEWLGARVKTFGADFELSFGQLVEDVLPLDLSIDQLPRVAECDGRRFSLSYKALTRHGTLSFENLLVVISDVTAEVERERIAAEQAEHIVLFQRLNRDRAGVMAFLREGTAIIDRLSRGGQSEATQWRDVHTLKGNASLYGMTTLAACCHGIETRLTNEGGAANEAERSTLTAAWAEIRARVDSLGGHADTLTVSRQDIDDLLERLAANGPRSELVPFVASLKDEPVTNRLLQLSDLARELSGRLGRGKPEVSLTDHGLRLPDERFAPFWASAVHVIRNAVDHGFEPVAARVASGKSPAPRLRLSCVRVNDVVELVIEDDGLGIDWARVAQKARAKGLAAESHSQLVTALFAAGVSTRDAASDISGRGIGLSAVKQVVEAMGGTVTVTSTRGLGTRFCLAVPLVAVSPRRRENAA